MSLNATAISFLVLATSCGLLSSFLISREIEEVNRYLPPQERIEFAFMYPGKMKRIKTAYIQFCPTGKIDRWRLLSQTAMSLFLVLTAISAGLLR